jgi:hypothetical protein
MLLYALATFIAVVGVFYGNAAFVLLGIVLGIYARQREARG